MDKKILLHTFRNTIIAAVYILIVSQIMQHGNEWFGREDTWLTAFVVLMLFSLSAAIVGGLVFGESVMLFFENKRLDSIKAALYSVGWLGLYTVIGLVLLALVNFMNTPYSLYF